MACPQLIDIKEAAARLRVHPNTLRRMVRRGEIPCVFVAARILRFDERALAIWVEQRTSPVTDPSRGRPIIPAWRPG